jgi:hypothetical protein
MTVYTDVFGGGTIYPAEPTFLSLAFSSNVTLEWPIEQAVGGDDIAAKIINLHPTTTGLSVSFDDARQVSTGYTATFANREASTVTIKDQGGNTIMTVASGLVWTAYLIDNSTANGTWDTFQQGAGSSTANAAALAGAGLKAISTTLNTKMAPTTHATDYVIVNADRATIQEWTGGTGTLTLPDPATVGSDWYVGIKNAGSGSVTITPPSGTIDSSASILLAPTESTFVYTDGTDFWTMGLGQEINSVFDFIQIDVSGTGDFTLTGAQLNRIAYRLTGILTGNRNIIVPAFVQQYWVDNSTTGAFTLTVKTAAGSGEVVIQSTRNILYCDGTDVVVAVTFSGQTFADGSAASPSITFTNNPTSGFYNSAGAVSTTTGGVQRSVVDTTGHYTYNGPSSGTTPTVTITGINAQVGVLTITNPFSMAAATPGLVVKSTAVGGFSTVSICGDSNTPGTDDFALFQNGSNDDCTIINRSSASGAGITIQTSAGVNSPIDMEPNGVNAASFNGGAGGGNAIIGVSGNADAIGFRTLTQTSVGAAGGASALPATPVGYMTVTVNSASVKIPYYNP